MIDNFNIQNIINSAFKIRKMQIELNNLLINNKYNGIPFHLSFGNELFISFICNIHNNLSLFLTHRNLIWNLFYIDDLYKYISTINEDGVGLGSMNSSGVNSNIIYTTSILGNNIPIAIGYAYSKKNSLIVADTGDGAFEEGVNWESLHMMKKFHTPLLIIIQDNDQSMYTNKSQRVNFELKYDEIANAFNIDYLSIYQDDNLDVMSKKILNVSNILKSKPLILHYKYKAINNHHGATPGYTGDQLILTFDSNGLLTNRYDPLSNLK